MTENPTGVPEGSDPDGQAPNPQDPNSQAQGSQAPQGPNPFGGGPGYPPTYGGYQQPYGGYQQPYGPGQPMAGYNPYVDPLAKSRLVAGLLGIFVGSFGVHRFYLGYTTIGIWQIVVTFVTCGFGALWGFIEGIMYLASNDPTFLVDADGRPLTK